MSCTPSFPDVPAAGYFVIGILAQMHSIMHIFILVAMYILFLCSKKFLSKVRFIPHDIPLNLLVKKHEENFENRTAMKICYFVLIYVLFLDENASLVVFIEQTLLNECCLFVLLAGIHFNIFIIPIMNMCSRAVVMIIFKHRKIFDPVFSNFELTAFWIFLLLIKLSSDVHPNPGPHPVNQNFSSGFLSFCNWNLNTLSKDDFYRISLLEAHNTLYKYDIISLCETSLSDDITVPENSLPGYIYHPLNNPDGSRNGGVGIFYKDTLPLRIRDDLSFDECLVTELIFGHKKIFFTVFYRNPKHDASSPGFADFLMNFENLRNAINQENPYAMFFTGDVNGHTQAWYPEGDTNAEGVKLDDLFSNLNLNQIINEPTHFFRDDCTPSCIDIILTDQPNLVMSSGVRPSLDPTVKHQIVFCKLNFKIPPPPKYRRKLWHYSKSQAENIKKSTAQFPWNTQLSELKSPTQQVALLNKTILHIMSNFVPSTEKTIRPSEPPWFGKTIRSSLKKHNKIYKKFKEKGCPSASKKILDDSKMEISSLILKAKEDYLKQQGARLADPSTSRKTYWKIINGFLNKCKVPRIPPLFFEGNFFTDCKQKATIFNNYFAKQCTPFLTDSILPNLVYHTNKRFSSIDISRDEINDILKILKTNKAHGPDNISVSMIQLCGEGLSVPLQIIFQNIIETGIFPDQWKEANVTPVHKKKDKQTVSNYRPISLLPIFA